MRPWALRWFAVRRRTSARSIRIQDERGAGAQLRPGSDRIAPQDMQRSMDGFQLSQQALGKTHSLGNAVNCGGRRASMLQGKLRLIANSRLPTEMGGALSATGGDGPMVGTNADATYTPASGSQWIHEAPSPWARRAGARSSRRSAVEIRCKVSCAVGTLWHRPSEQGTVRTHGSFEDARQPAALGRDRTSPSWAVAERKSVQ